MRRMHFLTLTCVLLVAPPIAEPQDRDAEPAFEVVSIKPNPGERVAPVVAAPDRLITEMTVRDLIRFAWELPGFRITGTPSWAESERFVINAKAPAALAPGQARIMVQGMLRDRFGLRTHRESRDVDGYELVLARTDRRLGPSLTPATVDCEPFLTGRRPMAESGLDPDGRPRCGVRVSTVDGVVTQHLNGAGLSRLVTSLENLLARSVADKTGLKGSFNLQLTFSTAGLNATSRGEPATGSPDGPALFTALEDQLGLRLAPARTTVEILVVDGVQRPTPD